MYQYDVCNGELIVKLKRKCTCNCKKYTWNRLHTLVTSDVAILFEIIDSSVKIKTFNNILYLALLRTKQLLKPQLLGEKMKINQ